MNLNPEILARIQFAFTVSFHIIFPTISIGLVMFLAVIEGLWLKTKDPLYMQIYRFWLSIFAMAFGVGVVTGIVLSFEFGLGFAKFAQVAGPAIGPMIALEVLTSFFLEAGFLGIMLFGLHRPTTALRGNLLGGSRYYSLGLLDSVGQQLDADAGWISATKRTCRRDGLVPGDCESLLAGPLAAHALRRLPDCLLPGLRRRGLVFASAQAPRLRAANRLARNGIRGCRDRTSGFHRRHPVRDDVEAPALQNAGSRRLLGKAIFLSGSLLLLYCSRPEGAAESSCDWRSLSREHLAHAQLCRTCGRSK